MLLRRASLAAAAAGALLAAAVILLAGWIAPVAPAWAPPTLRTWGYDARLLVSRPAIALQTLAAALRGSPRVVWHGAGEAARIPGQGVELVGTLHRTISAKPRPGVLLLHGSTPQGRRLGLYRALGHELAARRYTVLAIDQRGYGESQDPPGVDRPEHFDFVADARRALDFLASQPGVDPQRLYLVGHSFGGDVALSTAVADRRVAKLVAIGPGRRFLARGGRRDAPELEYFARREMRYMGLPAPIPIDVFLAYRTILPIENHVSFFSRTDHPPLLLVDGERESEADRRFLRHMAGSMGGPVTLWTQPGVDHYANVVNLGALVVYDAPRLDELVARIDAHLADADPQPRAELPPRDRPGALASTRPRRVPIEVP